MTAAPRVSVVVRSMARPTLQAALASIAQQQHVTAEVVLVAACGPLHPEPDAMCGPHPLRFVTPGRRLTRPAAANAGLDAARGEWVTFLDDDDVFLPDHLAGLLAAARQAPQARVVTSYAKGVFADGRVEWFGQPFSLAQLHERNFIHLSAAIFDRELAVGGCRFDESLAILEDWDFMLQLAQRAQVHFVPLGSFQWNADAGDSGAGSGGNRDAAAFAAHRDRIYAKHAQAWERLRARTDALLAQAADHLRARRLADADAKAIAALEVSVNDPWALELRARVLQAAGRLADARSVQAHAVAVRPQDAGFVYNLAVLDRASGDVEAARRHVRKALALDPGLQAAQLLSAGLA
jgi:tetratricopeptide (TPR) repeat protein